MSMYGNQCHEYLRMSDIASRLRGDDAEERRRSEEESEAMNECEAEDRAWERNQETDR